MVKPDSALTAELHELFQSGSDQLLSTLANRYKQRYKKLLKLGTTEIRDFIEYYTGYTVLTSANLAWVSKKSSSKVKATPFSQHTGNQVSPAKESTNKGTSALTAAHTKSEASHNSPLLNPLEFASELITVFTSDVDNRYMSLPARYEERYNRQLPLRQKQLRNFIEDNTDFTVTGTLENVKVVRKVLTFSAPPTAPASPPVVSGVVPPTPPIRASVLSPIATSQYVTGRQYSTPSTAGQDVAEEPHRSVMEEETVAELVRMLDLCSSDEVGPTIPGTDSLFRKRSTVEDKLKTHDLLTSGHTEKLSPGCGLLGERVESTAGRGLDWGGAEFDESEAVYLTTDAPFCAICIGVQGAGKSHTMNVILENCLVRQIMDPTGRPVIQTCQPMAGLVLHFDQSQNSICEAVGLIEPNPTLPSHSTARVSNMVVLVSPTFYKQRKEFYAGRQVEVHPLLFDWATITATQLRKLMRLCDTDAQLYVSTMLSTLRDYQRDGRLPSFDKFLAETQQKCNVNGQSAPLLQRLELLKNFVRQSAKNAALKEVGQGLNEILKPGTLVVADLTDPMMSPDEACGVFQVLLEQFRGARMPGVGTVVAFDEAHKYLSHSGPGCVELSQAIVDTVRVMRHEGTRILISTQSPTTMPPELLSLTSVTIVHRFQSAEWSKYLSAKVTLPEDSFAQVKALQRGQALVLSSTPLPEDLARDSHSCRHSMTVNIRSRLTRDLGASRLNKQVQLESEEG